MARAKRKGYKELLLGKDVEIPKTNIAQALTEAEKKTSDLNEEAYGNLISAMDLKKDGCKVAFNVIRTTKNTEYENGNVQVAWKALENKYNPKTAPSLSRVHREFFGSRLKKGKDSDVWITYLEDLRMQLAEMDSPMNEKQFMIYIMNNLPKEYENIVLLMEQKMENTQVEDALTLEVLRGALSLKYERENPHGNKGINEDEKE